jgi:hypothetical protein
VRARSSAELAAPSRSASTRTADTSG